MFNSIICFKQVSRPKLCDILSETMCYGPLAIHFTVCKYDFNLCYNTVWFLCARSWDQWELQSSPHTHLLPFFCWRYFFFFFGPAEEDLNSDERKKRKQGKIILKIKKKTNVLFFLLHCDGELHTEAVRRRNTDSGSDLNITILLLLFFLLLADRYPSRRVAGGWWGGQRSPLVPKKPPATQPMTDCSLFWSSFRWNNCDFASWIVYYFECNLEEEEKGSGLLFFSFSFLFFVLNVIYWGGEGWVEDFFCKYTATRKKTNKKKQWQFSFLCR